MKDRRNTPLLLILPVSLTLCVAAGFLAPQLLLFLPAIPFFCLELLVLRSTRRWYLRILPLLPIAGLLALGGYGYHYGTGWDTLAGLIFGLLSISPAAGCLLAFGAYKLPRALPAPFSKVRGWAIAALVLVGCAGAGWGQSCGFFYWEAAMVKLVSFGGCFALALLLIPGRELGSIFAVPDPKSLKLSMALTAAVLVFLLGGYVLLAPWLDFSAVPGKLMERNITPATFPAVALYIICCNSLLEEVFFRGLAFLTLRKYAPAPLAWGFSALTFALYHVSIMDSWFHPALLTLMIAGLAVAGLFFNWLDRRGSIWCAWLVHAGANVGINLIGCRLLGIF